MLIPVILCGGKGSRLWPLSRQAYPKQLLTLDGQHSLLQNTALRAQALSDCAPVVICHHDYRFIVREQLNQVGIQKAHVILEPMSKNTAMAIALSAHFVATELQEEKAILAILPADHYIENQQDFCQRLDEASQFCHQDVLVTLGIKATHASEAYGYIELGQEIEKNAFEVSRFIEKPDVDKAQSFIEKGCYRWNAGIFLSQAQHLIKLFKAHAPDINQAASKALKNKSVDLDFIRPSEQCYQVAPAIQFDHAICEKEKHLIVVEFDTPWSDLGAWDQVHEVSLKDEKGNTLKGDVLSQDIKNTYIQAENRLVAAVGIRNCIIVESKDAVLVADKNHCQDVKAIAEKLTQANRQEASHCAKVFRPWGYYEILDIANRFKVKRIVVKMGQSLSLQKHYHRSEHWIVVKGTAEVSCNDKTFLLHENQSTYIPQTATHQLSNAGKIELELIEVQVGSYLGEDDIERLEDKYDRKLSQKIESTLS